MSKRAHPTTAAQLGGIATACGQQQPAQQLQQQRQPAQTSTPCTELFGSDSDDQEELQQLVSAQRTNQAEGCPASYDSPPPPCPSQEFLEAWHSMSVQSLFWQDDAMPTWFKHKMAVLSPAHLRQIHCKSLFACLSACQSGSLSVFRSLSLADCRSSLSLSVVAACRCLSPLLIWLPQATTT